MHGEFMKGREGILGHTEKQAIWQRQRLGFSLQTREHQEPAGAGNSKERFSSRALEGAADDLISDFYPLELKISHPVCGAFFRVALGNEYIVKPTYLVP